MKQFLVTILLSLFFITPVFAKNFETTVSVVAVNNTDFYDIELLLTKDGKIYIPFKQISELFEIKPVTNHSTHDIAFEYENKKGKI